MLCFDNGLLSIRRQLNKLSPAEQLFVDTRVSAPWRTEKGRPVIQHYPPINVNTFFSLLSSVGYSCHDIKLLLNSPCPLVIALIIEFIRDTGFLIYVSNVCFYYHTFLFCNIFLIKARKKSVNANAIVSKRTKDIVSFERGRREQCRFLFYTASNRRVQCRFNAVLTYSRSRE